MKTRLVLWGTDAKDERVLVAIALNAKESKVDIWTFPEQVATETLYNRLINEWRMGREIPFPNMFVQIERPLTLSESVLPEDIKVERPDLVNRAQTEWQFVVLSSKLYNLYDDELTHLKEKVDNLSNFDKALWEELKGFWEKVQSQIHDKNLFRDHARRLKDHTNELFTKLKEKRKQLDDDFKIISKENATLLHDRLSSIEERIEKGLGLQPLFEELKNLQKEYRDIRLTRDDRSKVWNRLDKAFKKIKERRYGPGYKSDYSAMERLRRRYDGLMSAIDKMQKSIGRDRRDMEFQDRRIEESEGQLEAQIRQAKMKMIEERILSKEAKLEEMLKTKVELDSRIEAERKKEEDRQAREELEKVKASVKEKIAEEIKHASEGRDDKAVDLKKAADAIKEGKQPKPKTDSLAAAAGEALSETIQEVSDTVKAVAEVVSEKITEVINEKLGSAEEE
jgi:DNA repair exonuclease SbcCD ATPase subunit